MQDQSSEPNDDIVVFKTFYDNESANLFASMLDDGGFEYFLTNTNLTSLGLYSLASGGIDIYVHRKDLEEIAAYISSRETPKLQEDGTIICPKCGSLSIDPIKHPVNNIFKILFLLFMVPFIPNPKKYKCKDCGKKF
jgi:DNA-directed RNA polymerase subunit RPC12/RpoP